MGVPNLLSPNTITGYSQGGTLTTSLSAILGPISSNTQCKVNSLVIANVDGSNAADATVTFYDGGNHRYLAYTVSVPADTSLVVISKDTYMYVNETQGIYAQASANGDLSYVISYEYLTS